MKLAVISKFVWAVAGAIMITAIVGVVLLLTYNIEDSLNTKVSVKSAGHTSVYVSADDAYKVSRLNSITLKINDKYETAIIQSIKYDDKFKMFELTLDGIHTPLLPDTMLDASIILGKTSIASSIFSGV